MKRLLSISVFLMPLCSLAQEADSTVQLDEIHITGKNRVDAGKVRYSRQAASQLLFPAGSVADVLQAATPFHIKSYGAGLLSSTSLRGSGAAHTPVIWNGINLQSSMNGQLDLSLLPAGFFSNIDIVPGGSSDLFGSGAIGGVIQLDNDSKIRPGFRGQAQFSRAGFHKNSGLLSIGTGRERFSIKASGFFQKAANNYPFHNRSLPGNPEQLLSNASTDAQALMLESAVQTGKKTKISLFAWYQNHVRKIPPTMLTPFSAAAQHDESLRTAASWNFLLNGWNVVLRHSFLTENLWYKDELAKLHSSNKAFSFINEAEAHRNFGSLSWLIGVNSTEHRASADGYGAAWKKQSRQALFSAWQKSYLKNKGKWKISFRQELNDGKYAPPAFSAGTDLELGSWKIRGHAARIYRLPNFNDLYWIPGGNPDIQPEKGYTTEAGSSYGRKQEGSEWRISVTGFYSVIDSWIIWLPQAGFWTPTNLQQVHSRGLEWEAELLKPGTAHKSSWQLQYGGSLTFSSNEKEKSPGDISLGKQLIYVPFWKNYARLLLSYKKFTFSYIHQITGARYTSSDNTSSIPAFQTADIMAKYFFRYRSATFSLFGAGRNIWNEQYEIIEWRPMPGRHFEIGINFYYN
jgi:vitamin B12 transporter